MRTRNGQTYARALTNKNVALFMISLSPRALVLYPEKNIFVKSLRAQSIESIGPLAFPVSGFLFLVDPVNKLYPQISQPAVPFAPKMPIKKVVLIPLRLIEIYVAPHPRFMV